MNLLNIALLITLSSSVFTTYMFCDTYNKMLDYKQSFEESREMLESFQRTKGLGISPAFICKVKHYEQE